MKRACLHSNMSLPERDQTQVLYSHIPGKFFFVLSMILLFYPQLFPENFANKADSLTLVHIGSSCGSGSYSLAGGIHTVSGSGADVWNTFDECDFACIKLGGDMQMVARVTSVELLNNWTKAGVMIRQGTYPLSRYAYTLYAAQNLVAFQDRTADGATCEDTRITGTTLPYWVKIFRKGNIVVSQISGDGTSWNTMGAVTIAMTDSVYYGLAVTSHSACNQAQATFDHVSITNNTEPLGDEIINSIITNRLIYSNYVYDNFKIYVSLPVHYDASGAKNYPVVYYLDGNNLAYHLILRGFTASQLIPEVISVSIGYPGETQRNRDYTYGFSNFFLFLKNELIPYIDSHYPTNRQNRTLFGHSFGGICSLFTLFQYYDASNRIFSNIIPSSPSIWYPDGVYTYNCEQNLYNQTKSLPVNVYMTMGSAETTLMVDDFTRLSSILENRHYASFNFAHKLNTGQTHGSNSEVSFREGILWILNQPLPLDVKEATPSSLSETLVLPNPAHNVVTIHIQDSGYRNKTIEFISISGQTVYTFTTSETMASIDVSTFRRGIYIVKIGTSQGTILRKIVLQ